jgi:hypothetical protein
VMALGLGIALIVGGEGLLLWARARARRSPAGALTVGRALRVGLVQRLI